ncbi:hypothetical protein OG369_41590 [Streptomyces sp. NBC_01221]|uniref:hypothetical protein n=1 Tax=Streptomyces sp. NBC_01221 TaxID=2903782 RepID=UPI00224C8BE0|nr:hypothetical protein [Streptomyces sp. NBC_01221]MCX4792298.1 hypothetical protein [Streptomyces sp. NBC_01221]
MGRDIPETLPAVVNQTNLAERLKDKDVVARSAESLQEQLTGQEREPGTAPPESLTMRYDAAFLPGQALDAAGIADALLERLSGPMRELLLDPERVLGPDFERWRWPSRTDVGDPATLEAHLADQERWFPHHPTTITIRYDLARCRGDAAGAAAALEELFADQDRYTGPHHPDTLSTLYSLALWRGQAGDAAGAAAAFAELLARQERVLGPDHTDTLLTRSIIILWRGEEAGDPAGAVPVDEQLLADQVRQLEHDHREALMGRQLPGYPSRRAEEAAGATAVYAHLLAALQRNSLSHGPDRGHRQ